MLTAPLLPRTGGCAQCGAPATRDRRKCEAGREHGHRRTPARHSSADRTYTTPHAPSAAQSPANRAGVHSSSFHMSCEQRLPCSRRFSVLVSRARCKGRHLKAAYRTSACAPFGICGCQMQLQRFGNSNRNTNTSRPAAYHAGNHRSAGVRTHN